MKMAGQILPLLKQYKTSLPGLLILISFLFTSFLLYPHKTPKTKVAGISDSKITQKKLTQIVTPTPSAPNYRSVKSMPTVTASSDTASTGTTVSTENNTSPTTNTSTNNSSTPASSTSNESQDENVPTPTTIPTQPDTPVNNTDIPSVPSPTAAPTSNGNDAIVGNSVNTVIAQIAPTSIPQSENGGTILSTGIPGAGTSSVAQVKEN